MNGRDLKKYRELSNISISRISELSRFNEKEIEEIEENIINDNDSRRDYSRAINDVKMLEAMKNLTDLLHDLNQKGETITGVVKEVVDEYKNAPITVSEVSFDDTTPTIRRKRRINQ